MPTICASPLKARVARIVRNDVCGVPVTGTGSVVTTSGFISIDLSLEYNDGEEFLVLNANGEPCVNEKDANFLKRVGLTVNFCNIDPDGIVLMTGERLITGGAPVTGTGVAFGEGLLTARFSLEVWQPLAGTAACAGGTPLFMYWAFPNVGNAKIGNYTMENGAGTFVVEADTKAASTSWGDGPGTGTSWLPAAFVIGSDEHFLFNITSTTPPTPTCGATTL